VTLLPTTRLVAIGWLQLVVPGIGVDKRLPTVADYPALRTDGFLRIAGAGGDPDPYVPMRGPVIQVECWLAPPATGEPVSWARAQQLAERVLNATYDGTFMRRRIDLSAVGNYAPARVHTVTALTEPDDVEEPGSDWARVDLDLLFQWTAA
jgi:hypothetical protein